jgi:predicted ATPase
MVESVHKRDSESVWGSLSSLLVSKKGSLSRGGSSIAAAAQPLVPPLIRGLYMYGGVGCGKTMLMDLFVKEAPADFKVLVVLQAKSIAFSIGIH